MIFSSVQNYVIGGSLHFASSIFLMDAKKNYLSQKNDVVRLMTSNYPYFEHNFDEVDVWLQ